MNKEEIKQTALALAILIFMLYILTFLATFTKDCSKLIPENPYRNGSMLINGIPPTSEEISKSAGFEWSQIERGSNRDCEAYNEPFIEGCMNHVKQKKAYDQCLDIKDTREIKPVLLKECSDSLEGYCVDGL